MGSPELNVVSKLEDHYNIENKNQFSGQGSFRYTQISDNGKVFADFRSQRHGKQELSTLHFIQMSCYPSRPRFR